ncbi:MAG: hypothetical protein EB150_01875 [Nitrososphaeria archaeon]|nr:hypothetical protein [Nitrososphaeria archaeon]NDB89914.1 hypothetical protein [Nitrososphaerota archaeon]NDF26487.1 hypothetical protein [Nitrosopumilaceae archaeon]NDB47278.1 hypothetical protein [Nitrososphaeria archaeon]NDB91507.1 hypothetical protein [Nitrososphaeria archaeon]
MSDWGCIPELTNGCIDMTNSSSTYFSIIVGVIIGGLISLWIYNRQKKTSENQDAILQHIQDLDENHDKLLKRLEKSEEKHQITLDAILNLSKKIDSVIEKQEK